ncbi:MAG: hypothetical protein ACRENE_19510, partial [Polyangiaceae bacterium]
MAQAQSQRQRALMVVGAFHEDAAGRIREAATDVSVPTATVGQCDQIASALESVDPAAILLRMDSPGAGDACAHVRAHARFAQVPIFGVTGDRTDLAFPEIFGWGGDDLVVVASSAQPLVRRLRALLPAPMSTVPRPSGMMQAVTALAALAAGSGSTA